MRWQLKSSVIILAGQFAVAIAGLAMVRVLTEYLSPAEYGYLTLGLTFSLIANQIIFGPLGAGLTRFYATANECNETLSYMQAVVSLTKYASILLLGIAIIGLIGLFWFGVYHWVVLVVLSAIFSLLSGIYGLSNGIFLAKNSQIILTLFQGIEPWCRLVFAVGIMALFGRTSEAALEGYIIGTLITVLFQIIKIIKISPSKAESNIVIKSKWQKNILSYSLPYASWGIFTTLHLSSDRWVLSWAQGQEQVGLYATLYQIGYLPIIMIISVFSQIITPHLYKIAGDGLDQNRLKQVRSVTKRALLVCIGATLIMVLFGWVFHELIYKWFVSEKYASVSYLIPLMIFAAGLFASGQIVTLALQSGVTTAKLMPIKIICALIGVFLNFILGTKFGVLGVVLAQVIFSMIYLSWVSARAYLE